MDTPRTDVLIERLEHLERENRRIKRIGALALVGATIALVGGAQREPTAHSIEAERFLLRDDAGRIRAILEMTEEAPTLAFYDKQGKNRARLEQADDGSMGLSFFDKDEIQQIGIGVEKDGSPGLSFDKGGKRRLGVGINRDGSAVLGFTNEAGKTVAAIEQRPDGSAGLGFFGVKAFVEFFDKEKSRLSLGVNAEGSPFVKITDKNDIPLLEVPHP